MITGCSFKVLFNLDVLAVDWAEVEMGVGPVDWTAFPFLDPVASVVAPATEVWVHAWSGPVVERHVGEDSFNVEVAIGAVEAAEFHLGEIDLVHVFWEVELAAVLAHDAVFLQVLDFVASFNGDATFLAVEGDTAFFGLESC